MTQQSLTNLTCPLCNSSNFYVYLTDCYFVSNNVIRKLDSQSSEHSCCANCTAETEDPKTMEDLHDKIRTSYAKSA